MRQTSQYYISIIRESSETKQIYGNKTSGSTLSAKVLCSK